MANVQSLRINVKFKINISIYCIILKLISNLDFNEILMAIFLVHSLRICIEFEN